MNGKILIGFVLGIVGAVSVGVHNFAAQPTLPVLGKVKPFTLSDTSGSEFKSRSLTGKIWVANFFFTSCRGICPTIMGEINAVRSRFEDDSRVAFVSITVDPERDSTEKLLAYKRRFTEKDERWHFLTGKKSMVDRVSETAFQLAAASVPDAHSQRVVLVDERGVIRGYYNGLEKGVSKNVAHDLAILMAEAE